MTSSRSTSRRRSRRLGVTRERADRLERARAWRIPWFACPTGDSSYVSSRENSIRRVVFSRETHSRDDRRGWRRGFDRVIECHHPDSFGSFVATRRARPGKTGRGDAGRTPPLGTTATSLTRIERLTRIIIIVIRRRMRCFFAGNAATADRVTSRRHGYVARARTVRV